MRSLRHLVLVAVATFGLVACGGTTSGATDSATSAAAGGAGGADGMPRAGGAGRTADDGADAGAQTDAGPDPDLLDSGPFAPTPDGPLDDAGAPELTIAPAMFLAPMLPLVPVEEGADIPLALPPQGGHVLFVGARIENIATDTVVIRGRLRDPATGAIFAEESRTVTVRPVDGQPGVWETNPASYSQHANIAVCPDSSQSPVDGGAFLLELTLTELYVDVPRSATATRHVVPRCPVDGPDAALCACECAASYVLGKCPPSGMHGGLSVPMKRASS